MPHAGAPLVLDGSFGEGGGGLIRTGLAMAALTQRPVRFENVRAGTDYPGIDLEDLWLARSLATACAAETVSLELGGSAFSFLPTRPVGPFRPDLTGAGLTRLPSAPVIANALLPVMARSGVYASAEIEGETYGRHCLSYDYFADVTLACHRKFGIYAFAEMVRAGFGHESRGQVRMEVEPSALHAVDLSERGRSLGCYAVIAIANLPPEVGERGVSHLERLGQAAGVPLRAAFRSVDSATPGAYVTAWAEYESGLGGVGVMGARGLRMESVAQQAFSQLSDWMATDATVDRYLADQVLITACFAEGETRFRVDALTATLLTSAWVIKQFVPMHITINGQEGERGTVSIRRGA